MKYSPKFTVTFRWYIQSNLNRPKSSCFHLQQTHAILEVHCSDLPWAADRVLFLSAHPLPLLSAFLVVRLVLQGGE